MTVGVVQPESRQTEWIIGLRDWWIGATGIRFNNPKIQLSSNLARQCANASTNFVATSLIPVTIDALVGA